MMAKICHCWASKRSRVAVFGVGQVEESRERVGEKAEESLIDDERKCGRCAVELHCGVNQDIN